MMFDMPAVKPVTERPETIHRTMIPLEDRLRREAAGARPGENTPEEDNLVDFPPIISLEMEEMVREWAKNQFLEVMMYGDEEQTGVPPLSIEG